MLSHPYWLSWLRCTTAGLVLLAFAYGFANTTDLLLIGVFTLFRKRNAILRPLNVHKEIVLVLGGVTSCLAALYHCIYAAFVNHNTQNALNKHSEVEPLFLPCGTTHMRLFPKKHSFSYSYLLTGFQVGWKGSVGGILSVEPENYEGISKRAAQDWFVVDAGEYLEYGHGQLGLEGKLHRYLRSQNVDPAEFPYAYLVTVPKLLGYSFNPVSFWYLYSANKELAAMVLEVNNTFGERRPYFMKIAEEDLDRPEKSSTLNSDGTSRRPTRFTNAFPKDFHVSPFNSRKGAYSLIAYDPLFPNMTGRSRIDNTITLLSSKSHPKLVAHVVSKGDAVDPAEMGFISRTKFLSAWWWVVWATAIRTVKEAATLYFTHKLHVWFRPEPLQNTFGRKADETEERLEVLFRKYLLDLVENSETPLHVTYTAAGIPITKSTASFSSPSADAQPVPPKELEFKVLTPMFYTRFIHYASASEAFSAESSEYGTLHLSDSTLVQSLLSTNDYPRTPPSWSNTSAICFQIIKQLRRNPEILSISQPGKKTEDTPSHPYTPSEGKPEPKNANPSGMEGYILTKATKEDRNRYTSIALRLTLSERLAVGFLDILSLGLFLGRLIGAWLVAKNFSECLEGVLS